MPKYKVSNRNKHAASEKEIFRHEDNGEKVIIRETVWK